MPGHLNFDFAGYAGRVDRLSNDDRESLIRWDWELDPAVDGEIYMSPNWDGYAGADLVLPAEDRPASNLFIAGPISDEASAMMLLTAIRSIRPCYPEDEVDSCEGAGEGAMQAAHA